MILKRIITILYALLALTGLLAMVSFKSFNDCSVAATNAAFIKDQTKLALETSDFQLAKYHAYKALNGIWSAKNSFSECGCNDLVENMVLASENLREATKASNHDDSKVFLRIAMHNTITSITAIEDFREKEKTTDQADQSLLAEEVAKKESTIDFETSRIEEALEKFESSLSRVVEIDDCDRAYQFVRAMQEDTKAKLMNKDVSQRKHYYLTRVVQITDGALEKLGKECMPSNSLAGK